MCLLAVNKPEVGTYKDSAELEHQHDKGGYHIQSVLIIYSNFILNDIYVLI